MPSFSASATWGRPVLTRGHLPWDTRTGGIASSTHSPVCHPERDSEGTPGDAQDSDAETWRGKLAGRLREDDRQVDRSRGCVSGEGEPGRRQRDGEGLEDGWRGRG